MKEYSETDNQVGSVIIFVALLLLGLVGVSALAIDGWQILLTARDAQQAADSAALAGVESLSVAPPPGCTLQHLCYYPQNQQPWKNVKKGVLAAIAEAKIGGLNQPAKQALVDDTLRFTATSGVNTFDDEAGYQKDTAIAGNLKIITKRGIQCYNSAKELLWFPLDDGMSGRWCRVNAVRVEVVVTDIQVGLMQVLGIVKVPQVSAFAVATRRPPASLDICGSDQCSLLGTLNETTGSFVPFPC